MKKRLFSILLALLLLPCVFFTTACKKPNNNNPQEPAQTEFVYEKTSDGEYIYFGYYPQTIKSHTVTVSQTPDINGYYLGSDGEKYVKQVATYVNTEGSMTVDYYEDKQNILSDGQEMTLGESYYFKLEKLKWRILKEESGRALIMCVNNISTVEYQKYYDYSTYSAKNADGTFIYDEDGTTTVSANNYKYSVLRDFLTNSFYNQAFTQKQKAKINLTTVVNNNAGVNSCANTTDYVFALSVEELTNEEYGFSSNIEDCDSLRNFVTTDYAKATGAFTITSEWAAMNAWNIDGIENIIGSGNVWTRTPYDSADVYARSLAHSCNLGRVCGDEVQIPWGTAPALYINL